MFKVTKEIHFCYGHRLLHYEGKCRFLHGHNAKVEIELTSETLDHRGMVVDFEEIKRVIQRWIDTTLDHTLLLNEKDPLIPALRAAGERYATLPTNPTAETIAEWIFTTTQGQSFPVTRVTLWETDASFATYQPSL
jgi:6-pyruvoyltetrahydropterin/6-carboxytetrahydropterin synthase